jgi:uncharacterized protein YdaU (DUF1376 family)
LGDYAKDTGHLTLLEHGVYTVLLDWQYGTEKALPSEPTAVERICRAYSKFEKNAVNRVRTEFFDEDGWNKRADKEIEQCKTVSRQKRIGALRKHHSELAELSDEQVVEWCKTHGYALDEQGKCTTTRARSKTPRRQDAKTPRFEGGVQVSDDEILGWAAGWPGELATGLPGMDRAWVEQKLVQLNGRNQWPADWQRWLIACWRGDYRTFSAGEQNPPQKKNAPISASVSEISRQKKLTELSEEEDALAYGVNALRQSNIEVPTEKLERLKVVREELKKMRA